jgi:UDP-N-acetylglucosamine 2-epimerase (non-hydrolysing)
MVGDLMFELLNKFDSKIPRLEKENKNGKIFCTIHRAENTDSPDRLSYVINALSKSNLQVDLFVHPRLLARSKLFGIDLNQGKINLKDPISYVDTITTITKYSGVITDSGGLQKEAYFLSVPCLTVRNETEWPETFKNNWNRLDPGLAYILENWWELPGEKPLISEYGDGDTSSKILEALIKK